MHLTDEQIAHEVAQIENQDDWPLWPVLPMKLLGKHGSAAWLAAQGDPEPWNGGLALMFAHSTTTIYAMTLFSLHAGALAPQLEGVERLEFESTEALVRAGWVGD